MQSYIYIGETAFVKESKRFCSLLDNCTACKGETVILVKISVCA